MFTYRKCTIIIVIYLFTISEICTCPYIVDVSQIVSHNHMQSSAIDKLLLVSFQPATGEIINLVKQLAKNMRAKILTASRNHLFFI
jgi:hypothetical protein